MKKKSYKILIKHATLTKRQTLNLNLDNFIITMFLSMDMYIFSEGNICDVIKPNQVVTIFLSRDTHGMGQPDSVNRLPDIVPDL